MASRLWSDFGAHIPLVRSFSMGDNWPPEYPIFPGEKIRYHFLFYLFAGLLERAGFRIDWAVNIPSIIGFFLLLVMIYTLATHLFQRKSVGVLSVVFFLFNGSLSFLKFFEKHPLGPSTIKDILTANQFATFGPWSGDLVTAFVHLNIYTNQRHIGLSFGIVLFIIYALLNLERITSPYKKHPVFFFLFSVFLGTLAGSLFFLNHPALLIAVIFCAYIFVFHGKTRVCLCIMLLTTLPFLWYFFQIAQPGSIPIWEVGYLSKKPFAWETFFEFWLHNLGIHLFLLPVGFIVAPKNIRFLFIPLVILFILPNLYRFSTDMINNHKFFNFFTIIAGMYTANLLVKLFSLRIMFITLITIIMFILSIFSGILDFIVIHNDYYLVLLDIPANKDAAYFATYTPPDAVVLNSFWLYHPASLAGRKIYNGYSFFTWSAGYPTYQRESLVKQIFQSEDVNYICAVLGQEHISFVELNRNPEGFIKPIGLVWSTFAPRYDNPKTGVRIYKTQDICAL
jgi:hypothetical protein